MTISEQDKKSVEEERKKSFTTKRATVEGLENSLFKIFPVLDHGLVRVIDYMGDDDAIVQAARVSYGCLLYTSPSPRDLARSRMPSSA